MRNRKHGDLGVKPVDAFITEIRQLIDSKSSSD